MDHESRQGERDQSENEIVHFFIEKEIQLQRREHPRCKFMLHRKWPTDWPLDQLIARHSTALAEISRFYVHWEACWRRLLVRCCVAFLPMVALWLRLGLSTIQSQVALLPVFEGWAIFINPAPGWRLVLEEDVWTLFVMHVVPLLILVTETAAVDGACRCWCRCYHHGVEMA